MGGSRGEWEIIFSGGKFEKYINSPGNRWKHNLKKLKQIKIFDGGNFVEI